MRIRITRKNKRRKDPRYFLHENLEEVHGAAPEGKWPPIGTSHTEPEEHGDAPEGEWPPIGTEEDKEEAWDPEEPTYHAPNDPEGSTERLLRGVEHSRPGDWEGMTYLLLKRIKEHNDQFGSRRPDGEPGRDIDLEVLIQGAKNQVGEL